MFFITSKVLWFLLQPSGFVMVSAILGAALIWTRWWRTGRWLLTVTIIVFAIGAVTPLGNALILPLEQRFAIPKLRPDAQVDGIVILGGALSSAISVARGVTALNEAAERLTVAITLARRFPDARLLFTGGSAAILYDDVAEAGVAGRALAEAGIDPGRVLLERQARNTHENAVLTKKLAQPRPGETWLLITSAAHMPRAVGCFRKVGFEVVAWPVDYRTRGPEDQWRFFGSPAEGLRRLDWAVHEWLGLLAYRMSGRIDALLPGPQNTNR